MRRFLFGLITTAGFAIGFAPAIPAAPQEDLDDIEAVVETEPEPLPGYEAVPVVRLSDVIESPDAFHSTPFRFTGQFFGFGEVYSPFYTVFEPGQFYNFGAWGGEDPIWLRENFVSPHAMFYMDRKNRNQAQALLKLKRFERFHAVGIVRSDFRSRAWIEILNVQKSPAKLDRRVISNFIQGYRLKNAGEYDLASLRFAEACSKKSPVFARKAARLEEGRCLMAAGEFQEAVQTFARGMREFPYAIEFKELHTRSVASARAGVGAKRAQGELFDMLTEDPSKSKSSTQDEAWNDDLNQESPDTDQSLDDKMPAEDMKESAESMTQENMAPDKTTPDKMTLDKMVEDEKAEEKSEPQPPSNADSSEKPNMDRPAKPLSEQIPPKSTPTENTPDPEEKMGKGANPKESSPTEKSLEDLLPLIDKTDLKGSKPKDS